MKRLMTVFLVGIIALTVLSAGGNKETQTKEETKVQTQAKAKEPVEIHFWHAFSDEPRSNWIMERAAEFNAMQSEYKVIAQRKGSYRETLQAAVLAARQGNPPHCVQLFEVGSQLAKDSGIFEPVGNIGSFDTSDYIEPVLNYYTIDGTVNSIPFNSSSPILYYNKDLFRKAGLNPEKAPATFSEVMKAGKAAKKIGVAGLGFNIHGWFYEQWMSEQNAMLVNNGNGRDKRSTEVLFDSKASKNILNFLKEMNDRGYYTYTGKLEDWGGSDAIFQEGKVMMHITSTADVGNIAKAVEGKFELGTAMLPIPDGVKRNGTVIGGASIWVLKDHDMAQKTAARDFILFMTNTENMVSWHKLTGYYPVRNSSVKALEDEGWFTEDPLRTIAFTQLLETVPNKASAGAMSGTMLDNRTIIEEAMQKVLNGTDVNTALADAAEIANAKLAEYNSNF